jgi:hypothetical protein
MVRRSATPLFEKSWHAETFDDKFVVVRTYGGGYLAGAVQFVIVAPDIEASEKCLDIHSLDSCLVSANQEDELERPGKKLEMARLRSRGLGSRFFNFL